MNKPDPIQPLVSVVLCTFNGAAYLREQLDSLLSQTYPNLEIVVSDDASTDGTVALLDEYKRKNSRLRYTVNPTNTGFNLNFEKAILSAAGEFIATCDQDDIWESEKVRIMMEQWPADAEFVYSLSGSFAGKDFAGRRPAPDVRYGPVDDLHQLVFNSPVHGHASMFRKELVNRCRPFPPDIFYDWWISMHAAAAGVIGCIPQTLTWHRVHDNNFSRTLTSIKDEKERNGQLRKQCAYFIETFCSRGKPNAADADSLQTYASLLNQMDGSRFSWPMFRYVMKNRKKIFHYKKAKPLIGLSYLKHALRMARKGLL